MQLLYEYYLSPYASTPAVFRKQLYNSCVKLIQFKEVAYYPLSVKSVFLITDETYHFFYCKNHNWICKVTCTTNCKMYSTLQAIIVESDYWSDTSNHTVIPQSNTQPYRLSQYPLLLMIDSLLYIHDSYLKGLNCLHFSSQKYNSAP